MIASQQRNQDGTYGPTKKGKLYLPKPDHRTNSRNNQKSKWLINENQELSIFEIAENPEKELFCNENNCYFALVDNAAQIIGTKNERMAKFPSPQNKSDAWHGYPVTCHENHNSPSDDLLDIMVDQSIISPTTRKRIEKKKI